MVVPAVGADLYLDALRAHTAKLDELEVAGVCHALDADGATTSEETNRLTVHNFVFDVDRLLDPTAVGTPRLPGPGRGDAVDREKSEFAHQGLMMDAAEGRIVHDALDAWDLGREPSRLERREAPADVGPPLKLIAEQLALQPPGDAEDGERIDVRPSHREADNHGDLAAVRVGQGQ